MIRKLFVTLLLAGFGSVAFASSCPLLMNDIDAALKDSAVTDQLSEEQLAEVRQLREEGEKAHKSGDHARSVEALSSARALLDI